MSHWQIGDVRITKFVEKEFAGSVHRFLLLDATPEACKEIEWLKPHFMTEKGELRLSIHGSRDSKSPHHRRYVFRQRQTARE